jgi:uncharacterized protein
MLVRPVRIVFRDMGSVAQIWRYPVKALGGERLSACMVGEAGLTGDRRWAIVDQAPHRAGKLLTIKHHNPLLKYRARMAGDAPEVVTPSGEVRPVDRGFVSALAAEAERPLELRDSAGNNFDVAPILLVNLATVAAFGQAAGEVIDHRRFRANLYVDGLEPEDELGWLGRTVAAGACRLDVVSRCERCVVITHDPDTTVAKPGLLRVLTETQDACMGVYCNVVQQGRVAVGDFCGPE